MRKREHVTRHEGERPALFIHEGPQVGRDGHSASLGVEAR